MVDLSDVPMDGVKAAGDPQGLPIGTYLVRIEDSERKVTKDKFYEGGAPHEDNGKNFYLQLLVKVYGGPNDGHGEYIRLNLWNTNATAVNIAKSELKAIQEAAGVFSPNSDDLHNKWMVLHVQAGFRDKTKLYNKYEAAPLSLVSVFSHVPPVAAKASPVQHTAQSATPSAFVQPAAHTGADLTGKGASAPVQAAQPAAAQSGGDDIPSWMKK